MLEMPRNQSTPLKPIKPASGIQTMPLPAPSLGQSMKEGFGLGIGMSVARNIVDRVMGPAQQAPAQQAPAQQAPAQQAPAQQAPAPPPATPLAEFKKCMEYKDDYEACKIHLE